MSAFLTFDHLSVAAPDGRRLFSDLTISVGRELVGIVGRNGSGKSTLLSVASGEREPSSGTINRSSHIAMLRQIQPDDSSIAEALGVASDLDRLRRLEIGEGSAEDAGLADWTLEQRIEDVFDRVKLPSINTQRSVASLSGGERTRLGLVAMLLTNPNLLLMDEPTNNLDVQGREAIADLLDAWPGGALIASHDRDLLERVDRIVHLSQVGIFSVTGGWSAFIAERDALRERLETELASAEHDLKQQRIAVQRQVEKKARRDKAGRARRAKGIDSKLFLNAQAERAEHSAARDSHLADRLIGDVRNAVDEARRQVEIVTPLTIDLPQPDLPANRTLLKFDEVSFECDGKMLFGPLSFSLTGPMRVVVSGPNGSGKTSLLRLAMGLSEPSSGHVKRINNALAMLDQHVELLDPRLDLVANMQARHAKMTRGQAHEVLARFAFRNQDALRSVSTLSGGERLRAGLAMITGGPSTPQMLVLDEPTNHLDVESIEMLEQSLSSYKGALMLVSHDRKFLDNIGYDDEIHIAGYCENG
ncbi:ABC-F family ATP-binding cassette domain-containing protein [Parasphingorhabdus cellanae]|uniref:ABC-F family ATP-binding cassette domain-containing protein n=1 Tax=Parasphingorhabdus cellanae TaxID=2806553 RepID=A0ABX7T152_9SPHN|nr:ABC-F family ATP-binding cassette domain-containing protein [Parasphingorhabdus cellanae]QTD55281.1 ABC-F family ATP-binding cassette domain-containing protein [Parasphingorhabdus cellanae]